MVNIKITAGIMFLFMLSGILWLFIGQKKLKTKEKLDHMIAAILSAIFGPIGDVWSRCAFYNGALEITNLKHSCWSFLVVLLEFQLMATQLFFSIFVVIWHGNILPKSLA